MSEISEERESSQEGQALIETSGNADRLNGRLPRVRKAMPPPTLKENEVTKEKAAPAAEPEPARKILDKAPTRLRATRKVPSSSAPVSAETAPEPAPASAPVRETRPTTRARAAKSTQAIETGLPDLPPLRQIKTTVKVTEMPNPPPSPLLQPEAPKHPRPPGASRRFAQSAPSCLPPILLRFWRGCTHSETT